MQIMTDKNKYLTTEKYNSTLMSPLICTELLYYISFCVCMHVLTLVFNV
jgi:hypothetical protein